MPTDPRGTVVEVLESSDPRLRRHVVHDPRSRDYALPAGAAPTKLVTWPRRGPVLNQGSLGSCTGHAAVGLLMTEPNWRGKAYTDADARWIYSLATQLDDPGIPGQWPPTDTGSSGLAAMKALQRQQLISGYAHAFSLEAALAALAVGPVAVGTVWLKSMFSPDGNGLITVDTRSGAAGGHEYVVDGYDPKGFVRMTNSWGAGWGKQGQGWMRLADFAWLLGQQGDVVQPTVSQSPPAPQPIPPPAPQPTPPVDPDVALAAAQRAWQTAKGL